MPFDPGAARRWLGDIHHHIILAQTFAAGMSYDALRDDLCVTYAVTRCLEIISEAIDTEIPTDCAMWQMIGVLAEIERSLITERTRVGVKAAQRRGVKFGRKVKLIPDRLTHARKLIDQGKTPTEAAKIVGVGRAARYGALQREVA